MISFSFSIVIIIIIFIIVISIIFTIGINPFAIGNFVETFFFDASHAVFCQAKRILFCLAKKTQTSLFECGTMLDYAAVPVFQMLTCNF